MKKNKKVKIRVPEQLLKKIRRGGAHRPKRGGSYNRPFEKIKARKIIKGGG